MVPRRIRPGRANDGERLRRDDAKRRRARVLLYYIPPAETATRGRMSLWRASAL